MLLQHADWASKCITWSPNTTCSCTCTRYDKHTINLKIYWQLGYEVSKYKNLHRAFYKSFEVLFLFEEIGNIISYCVKPYKYFSDTYPLILKTSVGCKFDIFLLYFDEKLICLSLQDQTLPSYIKNIAHILAFGA